MERTDAPNDLDLTIAGPVDPIDALQVDPADIVDETPSDDDALNAAATESLPAVDDDALIDESSEQSEPVSIADPLLDTPFEMVEDEYTPMKFIGDPIAAILRGDEGSVLEKIDEGVPAEAEVEPESLRHPDLSEGSPESAEAPLVASGSFAPLTMTEFSDAAEAVEETSEPDAMFTPTPVESDPTPQGSAWVDASEPEVAEQPLINSSAASPAASSVDSSLAASDASSAAILVMPRGRTGAWWTLPLMFAGIAVVACAMLVPAADENRRAVHELEKINRDVAYFERQSEVNKQFLEHVSSDSNLAERLAMRQLRMTRPDAKLAPIPARNEKYGMSPYVIVGIDPPAPMPAYRPLGGFLGRWFADTRRQMYFCGAGLLMIAAGLIFGGGAPAALQRPDEQPA